MADETTQHHSAALPYEAGRGAPPKPHAAIRAFRARILIGCICLAGLAVRGVSLYLAPAHAFLSDHLDYMAWSRHAFEHGPNSLYDFAGGTLINVHLPPWLAARDITTPFPSYNRCNYPPLAVYGFWLQGLVWSALDQPVTLKPRPEIAEKVGYSGGPVTSRVANTVSARFANGFLAIATDFLWAFGLARLVRHIRPNSPGLAAWAFGIALLAPPVFLDSAFWNQTDSWLTCGMVWCLYLLATNRFSVAGVVYGVTVLVKAQAVLFAPVVAYAMVGVGFADRAAGGRKYLSRFVIGFAVTIAVLAGPYAVADGRNPSAGWLRWAYRGYIEPIRSDFPYTTLKAFNIWWADFVLHGGSEKALDAHAALFGLTKDGVGRGLFVAVILVAAAICARRCGWSAHAWLYYACLALLAAFLFPTRVHERYIYYALPFVICAALLNRRWLPAMIALLLVATFEMTWYLWYAPPYAEPWAAPRSPAAGAWSLILAITALASFVYALATLPPATHFPDGVTCHKP